MKNNVENKQIDSFSKSKSNKTNVAKWVSYSIFLIFFIIAAAITIIFSFYQDEALKEISKYTEFIKLNFLLSLLILSVLNIIGSLILIPGTLFVIVCGYIFGIYFSGNFIGFILSLIFFLTLQSTSGVIVFNVSKSLVREKIRLYIIEGNDELKKLDRVLMIYGFKALFLFRLSPIFPVTLLNYVLGGFNISSLTFFLSAYGSFPGEIIYTYIGYSMARIGDAITSGEKNIMVIGLTIFGFVVLVILLFVFNIISKRHFNTLIQESLRGNTYDSEVELNVANKL